MSKSSHLFRIQVCCSFAHACHLGLPISPTTGPGFQAELWLFGESAEEDEAEEEEENEF